MSALLVDGMGAGWTTNDAANLAVSVDPLSAEVDSPGSVRVLATAAAVGRRITLTPGAPIDLGSFDEIRFWVRSSRTANGSADQPFYLAFAYHDAADGPADEHRWLVPVARPGRWEQVAVGVERDRRTAIDELRFEALLGVPFECRLDELRAVRPEMLRDARAALGRRLASGLAFPALVNRPLVSNVNPNATSLVVGIEQGFAVGNLVEVRDPAGAESHAVIGVTHDTATSRTTLQFAATDRVSRLFTAATGRVSLVVPILDENPPATLATTTPALQLALLDAREDLERTPWIDVRDSFRRRGTVTVCSVRRAPRAYVADYMLTVVAPDRDQALALREAVLARMSIDEPLPIHGVPTPVWILPPPPMERDDPSIPPRVIVRLGLHMPVATRSEQPWVQRAEAVGGQLGAPDDREGIVLQL